MPLHNCRVKRPNPTVPSQNLAGTNKDRSKADFEIYLAINHKDNLIGILNISSIFKRLYSKR